MRVTRVDVICVLVHCAAVEAFVKLQKEDNSNTVIVESYLERLQSSARKIGLEAQAHVVRTADGVDLMLTHVKVVGHGEERANQGGTPVLLVHGLMQSSTAWLDAGCAALVPLLAARHDLWLISVRGSALSRPRAARAFWLFSADEMGRYDLPATIDYILHHTGARTLNYIGFSQGSGAFFIMCSEQTDYCQNKVNLMIALAPATRLLHTKSVLFRLVTGYFEKNEEELDKRGIWEALPNGGFVHLLVKTLCGLPNICEILKDVLDNSHPGSINEETFVSMAASTPAGTSVHNMAWYGQLVRSKYFQKFDYGPENNLIRYGSRDAPSYNLSATTVPTVIIYGSNDGIVDEKDVKWLVKKLPNVVKVYEMEDPLWTHLDFIISKHIPTLLFPKLEEILR